MDVSKNIVPARRSYGIIQHHTGKLDKKIIITY
jgi:hypothetical protein